MKIVIQRVTEASVTIGGEIVGTIGRGLMVLVGIATGDTSAQARKMAAKTAAMRLFPDERGVMNLSVTDIGGDILAVSQFTLLADATKGNRPSYIRAAGHELATELYNLYVDELRRITGRHVPTGRFGADMQVALVNDGPVTIVLEL
ncbi:MAG: D-aminoacyl-tRNA deacylase [Pseudoflavonifractor sp.]|nr:D-aminoacyl-tRNA deacylase [Alloprevotella sp.]MCM1115916.1 D-aminoacyl-tRNA deacylase [Pseudoflavonifractor sp.]